MSEPGQRWRSLCLWALCSRREAELAYDQAHGLGRREPRAWSLQVASSSPLQLG